MGRSVVFLVTGLILITMSVAHLADLQLIKDDSMAVVLLAYGIFGLLLAGSGFLGAKKPLC